MNDYYLRKTTGKIKNPVRTVPPINNVNGFETLIRRKSLLSTFKLSSWIKSNSSTNKKDEICSLEVWNCLTATLYSTHQNFLKINQQNYTGRPWNNTNPAISLRLTLRKMRWRASDVWVIPYQPFPQVLTTHNTPPHSDPTKYRASSFCQSDSVLRSMWMVRLGLPMTFALGILKTNPLLPVVRRFRAHSQVLDPTARFLPIRMLVMSTCGQFEVRVHVTTAFSTFRIPRSISRSGGTFFEKLSPRAHEFRRKSL